MDESRIIPAVSASEPLEWPLSVDAATQTITVNLARCCVGVDVPGVGWTHSFDCPLAQRQHTLPSRDAADEPFAGLRKMLREEIIAKLIFAARNLAEENIFATSVFSSAGSRFCKCGRHSTGVGHPILHQRYCLTGQVLGLIAELMAEESEPNPTKKEIAPTERETAPAGVGVRLLGEVGRECGKCGQRYGIWSEEQRPEAEVELSHLGLNQCVKAGRDGHGHTLCTHFCNGLRPSDNFAMLESWAR